MPTYRAPASAGKFRGELRLARDGMTFIPTSVLDGDQLVLGVHGWHLSWDRIAGIERVARSGRLRIHYDDAARFLTVNVQGQLPPLFAVADAQIEAARTGVMLHDQAA